VSGQSCGQAARTWVAVMGIQKNSVKPILYTIPEAVVDPLA
jgi:hypothetical protein